MLSYVNNIVLMTKRREDEMKMVGRSNQIAYLESLSYGSKPLFRMLIIHNSSITSPVKGN